jgi:hypothetical protein
MTVLRIFALVGNQSSNSKELLLDSKAKRAARKSANSGRMRVNREPNFLDKWRPAYAVNACAIASYATR